MSQAAALRRTAAEAGPSGSQAPAPHTPLERMAFTQAVMNKRFLPDAEARALYCSLRTLTSDAGYLELLADANRELASIHLELRRIKYLFDNQWYLALVNKWLDEVAKASGSVHTFAQLEGIALDPHAEDGKGSIGSTEALNLDFTQPQATQGMSVPKAKLTMAERRALMDSFVRDGWLISTPGAAGRYSIGPRSFLELHEFLLSLDLPGETRAAWERFL